MMKEVLFTGSGVALVTPFHEDLSINYSELERLVEYQIENGTQAIVACGTTSEASTMTEAEHLEVIAFIVKQVKNRIPVIAGTGSNDTRACVRMSLEAKRVGADALLIVTPYYNKTSQQGLIEHYEHVANTVKMPSILYNVPSRTGMNILPSTYARLSQNPYIVATKEANGNVASIAETLALCGDALHVYSGEDNLTLPVMALGGKGIISVFANALPKPLRALTDAIQKGDLHAARQLNAQYMDLFNGFFMDVNPIPVKTAMNMMGLSCGPCRMPLCAMSSENMQKMKQMLQNHGLL